MTAGQSKKGSATKCKCGSTSHKRSTHKNCPLGNIHQTAPVHEADVVLDDAEDMAMDFVEVPCSDDDIYFFDENDEDVLLIDAVEVASCTCNAGSRAHKKGCPLNSRRSCCRK